MYNQGQNQYNPNFNPNPNPNQYNPNQMGPNQNQFNPNYNQIPQQNSYDHRNNNMQEPLTGNHNMHSQFNPYDNTNQGFPGMNPNQNVIHNDDLDHYNTHFETFDLKSKSISSLIFLDH